VEGIRADPRSRGRLARRLPRLVRRARCAAQPNRQGVTRACRVVPTTRGPSARQWRPPTPGEVVGVTTSQASGAPSVLAISSQPFAATGRIQLAAHSRPSAPARPVPAEPAMTSGLGGAPAAPGRGDDQVGDLLAFAGLDAPFPTGRRRVRSARSRSSGRSSTGCRRRQSSRSRPKSAGLGGHDLVG
jgi:hypothetical protein